MASLLLVTRQLCILDIVLLVEEILGLLALRLLLEVVRKLAGLESATMAGPGPRTIFHLGTPKNVGQNTLLRLGAQKPCLKPLLE